MSDNSIDYSKIGIVGVLLVLGYAGLRKINEPPALHLAESNQLSRDESLDLATYITLKEANDKGYAGIGILGKLSRIPGFDRSAIGIFKGRIKEVADLRNHEPEVAANLLADLGAKVDVSLLDSLYLSPELKDYIRMISHAKLYRAFKEGLDDERIFIWKMVLLPIIEARSEEIYGKRATIINGFLDNPSDIFDAVYLKYTPFTPDSIEEIEEKLNTWGIPLNFPHAPDDLRDVDIESGKIGNTSDKVVVRFAPTPNGPLSIGHSRGVCLLGEYQKRYPGAKLLLRFDDTDPAKSTNLSEYGIENVFDKIIDEMNWLLDIELPDEDIIVASKRFEIYQNAVKNAISEGKAVCDTKEEGIIKGEEANLKVYEDMFAGKYGAGEAAIKLKSTIPKDSLNKSYAERKGEVLYRVVKHKGENLCVPLMNLQSVVDDKMYKVTHIVRGADHDRGNLGRQKVIWAELGYGPFPYDDNWGLVALTTDQKYQTYISKGEFCEKSDEIDETLGKKEGKIGIKTTRISTSRMRKGMDEGLHQEHKFDSPELPTLTSLRHEHQLIEGARPILASAIRAYWNIKRSNQDETAIFNRDELRELSRHILDEGYIFEEREYEDERERQDYIKKLKVSDRYYAEDCDHEDVELGDIIDEYDDSLVAEMTCSSCGAKGKHYMNSDFTDIESVWDDEATLKNAESFEAETPCPVMVWREGVLTECGWWNEKNEPCVYHPDGEEINAESFEAESKPCHHSWEDIGYQMGKKVWHCGFCKEIRESSRIPYSRSVCCPMNCICNKSAESFETKHEKREKVRTMSGNPHNPRKMVRDKHIRPEEAGKRTHLSAEGGYNWGMGVRQRREIFRKIKASGEEEINLANKYGGSKEDGKIMKRIATAFSKGQEDKCLGLIQELDTDNIRLLMEIVPEIFVSTDDALVSANIQLVAESFEAEGDKTCLMTGQVIPANKTYASAELALLAREKVSLFGGGGGYQRADLAKAVMVLKKSNMELSAAEWAERIKGSPNYRTNKELTPFNINSILKYLKPDVIRKRATRGGIKSKGYVYRLVKGNCLMDWIRSDYLPQEETSESFSVEGKPVKIKTIMPKILKPSYSGVYVITYATVGNAKGNLIPIDNLLFDVVKGEDKAYEGITFAVKDVIIEDFIKRRTSEGHSGDILDAQIDAFLMDKGIMPFNKNRFKTFMQTDEWESYFSKNSGFLWFTVTPLKDYIKKESPSWIYVPFS